MRPTDEDQPGARRPNLMSPSRRAGGSIHILAMLDGAGKARPKRTLLWSGIGGALACGLVGTALWMMRSPETGADAAAVAVASPAGESARLASAPAAVASAAPVQASLTLPALAANAAGGATIVNVTDTAKPPAPPVPSRAAPAVALPALPALPAHPLIVTAQHAMPAQATPPKYAVSRPAPHAVVAVAHAAPPRRLPAKPAPGPAPAVDTDVALISAIIQHAAAKHDGANDGGCGGKPCDERSPVPR